VRLFSVFPALFCFCFLVYLGFVLLFLCLLFLFLFLFFFCCFFKGWLALWVPYFMYFVIYLYLLFYSSLIFYSSRLPIVICIFFSVYVLSISTRLPFSVISTLYYALYSAWLGLAWLGLYYFIIFILKF
jgi:hypothetical protein